jgi:antitoxin component YwqK of YwqJK toxin-antitoxin module
MSFRRILILASFCSFLSATAQRFSEQVPQIRRYDQSEVLDTADGIKMYNKLIESIGGDSITYNKAGYNMQGWNEDYYKNGKLLHRGYYVDGKAVVFKNFYENGQCERTVVNPDPLRCNIDIYFEDGKQKKQLSYYNGLPQKKYEYYSTGLPKYVEENEKDMKYLTVRKSWYSNGQMENSIELADQKTKKYLQRSYYPSGQMKEEGTLVLSDNGKEYLKDGAWITYDNGGKKKKSEMYVAGSSQGSN